MSFDVRMLIAALGVTNVAVSFWTGMLVPMFWIGMLCGFTLLISPLVMRYRMHRLESDWKKSGGTKEIPPDDSGWLVKI